MGKDVTFEEIFPCWSTDKEIDVSKLSTEIDINLGNRDSLLHLASCFQ